METETYKFDSVTAADKVAKGKHTYGSKVDNSVCECPKCFGGGRLGLFKCENCRGTGRVLNEKDCPDCGGTGYGPDGMPCKTCKASGRVNSKLKCPNCGSTNIQKGKGYKLDKCLSCHTAFDNPDDDSKENSSKKDYIAHAAQIKNMPDREDARKIADHLIQMFTSDNPAFDKDRFLKACGF